MRTPPCEQADSVYTVDNRPYMEDHFKMFLSSEYEYEFRLILYNPTVILDISRSRNPGQCADNPGHFDIWGPSCSFLDILFIPDHSVLTSVYFCSIPGELFELQGIKTL